MESGQVSPAELTRMLKAWSSGDTSALELLTPIVYAELRRLARRNLAAEQDGHLFQPSDLVDEAFLRFMGGASVDWSSRSQFYAFSARVMRQILIDFARAQDTAKRGHRSPHVNLSQLRNLQGKETNPVELIDLDAVLNELAELDSRQAQVVELRYFGGLENAEIAEVLGISEPTVVRDWRLARAWMYHRLKPSKPRAARLTS